MVLLLLLLLLQLLLLLLLLLLLCLLLALMMHDCSLGRDVAGRELTMCSGPEIRRRLRHANMWEVRRIRRWERRVERACRGRVLAGVPLDAASEGRRRG